MRRLTYQRLWAQRNREALNAYQRAYYKRNRSKKLRQARARWAKNRAEKLAKARAQYARRMSGRPTACQCCGRKATTRRLSKDHNHATGAFRGWLCGQCNVGIGMLGDTRVGVKRAVRYLERAQ